MTKGTFGEHLKREREMRGVSLEEISTATRISTRFLEALENEQWERLPGGVFNRGFVRAVARFLGLDEESLVAEYALANNDRPALAVWATHRASPSAGARWLPWLLVLLLAAGAGGWFGWKRYNGWRAAALQPTPSAESFETRLPEGEPAAPRGEPGIAPASTEPAAEAAGPQTPSVVPGGEDAPSLELTVSAGRTTAVSVNADGRALFEGRMLAGETQHFQARERLEVTSRDSSALLLELNGQTVAPMGPPGRPGSVTLTRKDLKKSGGPD